MKLTNIVTLDGSVELLSGLHIGGGSDAMHIGGIDNPVIKHPHNQQPYIPGSSIKGKIRSLLEWYYGLVEYNQGGPIGYKQLPNVTAEQKRPTLMILQLFGVSGGDNLSDEQAREIGPSRLSFCDAMPTQEWVKDIVDNKSMLLTEAKSENSINRIAGVAENPRQSERVPSGAKFDFRLQVKILSTDNKQEFIKTILIGIKLLEMDALGGSGSRGYGRVKFHLEGGYAEQLETIKPFEQVE